MIAAGLALAASLLWGGADYTAGIMVRRSSLWAVVLLTQSAGLAVGAILVLVRGEPCPPMPGVLAGVAAGLTGLAAVATFYKALAIGVMSLVAPISATGIIVPVLVGLALGERPSTLQYAGMMIAIAGVLVASRQPGNGAPSTIVDDREARRRASRSLLLAIAAALVIGLTYVAMDRAAEHDPFWGVFFMRATSAPLVLVSVLLVRPRLRLRAADSPFIVLAGLADLAANALFSVATTLGLLSLVSVLGYLYPVVTVLLAHVLLRERLRPAQRLAATAALAGAVMVAA